MNDPLINPDLLETVPRCRLCKVVCEYEEAWFEHCKSEPHRKQLDLYMQEQNEKDLQRRIENERLKIQKRLVEAEKRNELKQLFKRKHDHPPSQVPNSKRPNMASVKTYPFKCVSQPQNQGKETKKSPSLHKLTWHGSRKGPKFANESVPATTSAYTGVSKIVQEQGTYPAKTLALFPPPLQPSTSKVFNQATTNSLFSPVTTLPSSSRSSMNLSSETLNSTLFNWASVRQPAPTTNQKPAQKTFNSNSSLYSPPSSSRSSTRFSFSNPSKSHYLPPKPAGSQGILPLLQLPVSPAPVHSSPVSQGTMSQPMAAQLTAGVHKIEPSTSNAPLASFSPSIFPARSMSPLTLNTRQSDQSAFKFSVEASRLRKDNSDVATNTHTMQGVVEKEVEDSLYLLHEEEFSGEAVVEQTEDTSSSFLFKIPDHQLPAENSDTVYGVVKVESEEGIGEESENEDSHLYRSASEDRFDIHPDCSSEDEEYFKEPPSVGGQSVATPAAGQIFSVSSSQPSIFKRNLLKLERPLLLKSLFTGAQ